MNRRKHENGKRKTAWVAGMGLALAVSACEPFWSTPETRARDFIEALVATPEQTQALREIANLSPQQNPEDLIDDLSARVSVDFLRARQNQGVALTFASGETRRTNDKRWVVMIHVTHLPPGTPVASEVRFLVRLEKDDQGRWRVGRITGEG